MELFMKGKRKMKTTGILRKRKVDELGRVTLPHELCKILGIEERKTHLEIFTKDEAIILEKYRIARACAVTGEVSNENKVFEGNVVLSSEGVDILLKQLMNEKNKKGVK